jgi:predicted nucleic acid-binding protein
MILVDTSVWINHLRNRNIDLVELLEDQRVLTHPFVIGELALGRLGSRAAFLADLANLPGAQVADDPEVLMFIESQRLAGSGLGYIDVHLLAATRLTAGAKLWSDDKRLAAVAESLEVCFDLEARP